MSATPLLDGLAPLPQRRRRSRTLRTLLRLFWFAVGAGLMLLAIAGGFGIGGVDVWSWYAAFFAAGYTIVFVHELGHLVCGLACGFRPRRFRVWPFLIASDGARVSYSIDWKSYRALTVMMPVDLVRYPRQKVWFALGGPAANIVLAAVAAPAPLAALAHHAPANAGLVYAFWIAMLSPIVAFGNLIPVTAGPFRSDGAQALDAWRRTPAFFREVALARVHLATSAGIPARDVDPQLVAAALEPRDGSRVEMNARVLAYALAAGRDEVDLAAEHLERALACSATALPAERTQLLVESAVFTAWHRVDAERARAWAAKARASDTKLSPMSRYRLDIFEPWIAGEREAALEACERYIAFLAKLPGLPVWDSIRADALEVRERLRVRALVTEPAAREVQEYRTADA